MKNEDRNTLFWLGFGGVVAVATIALILWIVELINDNAEAIVAFFKLVAITVAGTAALILAYVLLLKLVESLRQRRKDHAYNKSVTGIFEAALNRGKFFMKELEALDLKLGKVLELNKAEEAACQAALKGAKVGDKWAEDIWTQIKDIRSRSEIVRRNKEEVIGSRIRSMNGDIRMLGFQYQRCQSQGFSSPKAIESLRKLNHRHDTLESYINDWKAENPEAPWFFIDGDDDDDFLDLSSDPVKPTTPPRAKVLDILNKAAF